MISFVCWKWVGGDPARQFESHHVNVLRAMVARHYQQPHRFICVTDDPVGLDPRVEPVAMPVTFDNLDSPQGHGFPSCYRRLWNFSHAAKEILGERIFSIDIDVVIVGDLQPLIDYDDDFVGWCEEKFLWGKIAGGAYLHRTGTMPHVWEDFDPATSPAQAYKAGNKGSDQGWMSYKLFPPRTCWDHEDGLRKIGWTPEGAQKPPIAARIVFTNGVKPPWSPLTQRLYPWVAKHWTL